MSRLFTFFEILSHNLAFVCAPTPPTIHHRPYTTLVLPTSARLSPRWGNTTLCAAIVCDNTPRSMLRLFRCAQYAYAMRYCPCGQYAHLCTAISLRSIRRASSAMRSIDCLHSIPPYEPYLPSHRPHIFPTYSACAENLPAPRQILKIVEKKRLTYFFFFTMS